MSFGCALVLVGCAAAADDTAETNTTAMAAAAAPATASPAMQAAAAGAKSSMGSMAPAMRPAPATAVPKLDAAGGGGGAATATMAGVAAAGSNAGPASGRQSGSAAGSGAPTAGAAGSSAPTTAEAGSGAPAAGAAGSTPMASELPDLGKGDGSDVVTIGDSWMSFAINGGGIEAALDRAGTKYAHYAIPGTLLLNGQIPSQYDQAKRDHAKIATVIMTGGGNDVMSSGGCDTKEKCLETTQKIIDGLDQLFMKMATDGVSATVLIDYSKFAGSGPKGTRPDVLPTPTSCTTGKLRCLVIETTDIVGMSDLVDGVHPTQPATDRIAKRSLESMEKAGVRR